MITEIFLDLDDTLNRFTPLAMKYVGCPIDPETYVGEPELRGDYNLVRRVNFYRPGREFTVQEFWNAIPRDFWATVPVAPDADFIIEWAERLVGRHNVIILTSPTKDPECLAGKLEWIHAHLPPHYHRQYVITPRKQYASGPGRVLVDDCDANLSVWEAYGGIAVRVPQPWNSDWAAVEAGRRRESLAEKFERLDLKRPYSRV
jgi:5'(3')-deoxyribonucleotidase